ncbi:hypothetical protein BGX28_006131 [Mortierella sp. GBA30]|nr:hypothetical protein BGX28_006131 [Mortierella sp. GBA30]
MVVSAESTRVDSQYVQGFQPQGYMDWRTSKQQLPQPILQEQFQPHTSHYLDANQPPARVVVVTPTAQHGMTSREYGQGFETSNISQDEERARARMKKIAKGIIDCKNYDHCLMLPRHISQEYDELWVVPAVSASSEARKIPRQLLMLPKDANFLVDVFFQRHLMEPQTPQSLFLLNIVFMAACKHLARRSDIKRATQFRERAYEVKFYIDENARLSKIQAALLGSQVIYGVFQAVLGQTQACGTYNTTPPIGSLEEEDAMIDLEFESRSILSKKGVIPEAAYQQRLWTFWGLYARDCMSRLYFGWPFGIDSTVLAAEFPKIKGYVGLGGVKRSSTDTSGADRPITGKRRGAVGTKERSKREKKLIKAEATSPKLDRNAYRGAGTVSDGDDDDDEDDAEGRDDDGDLEHNGFDPVEAFGLNDKVQGKGGGNDQFRLKGDFNTDADPESSIATAELKHKVPSYSGLSQQLLELQSRGEDIGRRQGGPGSNPGSQSPEVRRHMERMTMLLEAEEDTTDGGSYARVLFLEEIKLWSIGRRVGLYLQSRSTSMSVSPAAAATGWYSPKDGYVSGAGGVDPFASTISATIEASRCSERAWLEDKELQGLQADLISWEKELPSVLKFRQDVDTPGVNHKVNGKMAILIMYYYTITILLQSSYLPIPQFLSSSSRSSAFRSPESCNREYDSLFSRATSIAASDDSGPRIKHEAEEYFLTGRSPQPSTHGDYFNTAHQICTQLSNVLYHHVELLLDMYPNWCNIQCKLNHSLTAAIRVSCLNARLGSNAKAIRDEAKAGFKMGSALFKKWAMLPEPLTIRDWPAEEDVQAMLDLEEEFRGLMTTQEEEEAQAEASYRSRSGTRDTSEGVGDGGGDGGGVDGYEYPGDHLLYSPDDVQLQDESVMLEGLNQASISSQYDIFHTEHVFGLTDEGFHFDYNMDA